MKILNVKALIDEGSLKKIHLRVFLCCIVSLTFEGYDLVVYGATLPLLMKAWNMTPAYAGFIASFGFGAAVLGAIAGGSMGDMWGRKRTIITSVVIYSLGSFVCALASSPEWFAFFRIFAGIGMGMTLQNEVGLVSEYFPSKSRQAAVAGVSTGMQLGGILSALVAILLIGRFGWASAYYFGTLPIVLVPVLIKYLPEAPWILVLKNKRRQLVDTLAQLRPDIAVPDDAILKYPKAQEKSSLAEVFAEKRSVSAILFWVIYFMNVFVIYGTNTWIPKLMMNSGHSINASLSIYLALFVGALVASPFIGHFADRFGSKRVSILCYLCGFIAILLLCLPTNIYLTVLSVALVGVCTMGAQNMTHAYVSLYFPPPVKSTMMGWGLSVGRTGGLLGPIVGGVLLYRHATPFQSYLAFALPCLISAVAVFFIQDRYAFNTHWAKGPGIPDPPLLAKNILAPER
jgi:AAHS family benzoate transporter-like MFS transporter